MKLISLLPVSPPSRLLLAAKRDQVTLIYTHVEKDTDKLKVTPVFLTCRGNYGNEYFKLRSFRGVRRIKLLSSGNLFSAKVHRLSQLHSSKKKWRKEIIEFHILHSVSLSLTKNYVFCKSEHTGKSNPILKHTVNWFSNVDFSAMRKLAYVFLCVCIKRH